MKRKLLFPVFLFLSVCTLAQNVFNSSDPIVRYNPSRPYGSPEYPDTNTLGLQKFVSTPTSGVSFGVDRFDASSFKAYFINLAGSKVAFRIKFPRSYTNPDSVSKKYPMMLFLHGAGEVGCPSNNAIYNNEKQVWLGGQLFMQRVDNNQFDGFLLYPQLVNSEGCWGSWGTAPSATFRAVIAMIDSLAKYSRADIDRLLVNGLSGGGYGAWRMADGWPQRVAKIIPSAAAGSVANRNAFVHIPIWFATGGKDPDPSPASAQYTLTKMQEIGADIRYTQYPELGHAVWTSHWNEPDYVAAMNNMHKANPLIFFQRSDFCQNETITAKLGITAGFYAYEWQKGDTVIATRTNGVNTIVQPSFVSAYTGNEISVTAFGSYRVRFKRTGSSPWSAFSPKPAIIKVKTTTQSAPISINGAKSNILPALDGSTTVPLQMPPGFVNYEWYRVSDNTLVATTQIFNAPVGDFKGRYSELHGCGTAFSPVFSVYNANGTPKPDAPTNLTASPVSVSSLRLNWTQVASPASNETGFEVYRATQTQGPYTFVGTTATNIVTYQDTALLPNTIYFYIVRAVNTTGASPATNEAAAKTLIDNINPSAPSALQYRGSNQTSVSLKWNAATDNDGIKRYDIYVNGAKMYSATSTSFTVINLDSLRTYAFTVKAVDKSGNVSTASNQVTGYTHRQGINFKYYTGTWTTLPDFNALTPAKTAVTDTVNINNTSIKTATTSYGFLWQGYIYIPVNGTYTFETFSDDGSKLYIDVPYTAAATPLVNNDGMHAAQSGTGSIALTEGYHSIAITYFQNTADYDMQLYWSSNTGLARERIPKNFFSFVNASITAVPAIPTGLTATALAFNKIRLNWTDNSSNETGFEVVRSLTNNGTFISIGKAPANAITFQDSGLTGSRAYYYKIRAVTSGSESDYTGQVTATTGAAPLTPLAPSNLVATGNASTISLAWTDNSSNETNFRIFRSTDGNTFTQIATLAANSNAFSDGGVVLQTGYYYYVAGSNASGVGQASNIVQSTAGDNAPIISGLASIFVKTNATATKDFTVTDNPTDVFTVTLPDAPPFMHVTNIGGNNFRLTATPTVSFIGWFQITVAAADQYGKTSTTQVTISVADKNTRSVFINLGSSGSGAAPSPWNNWLGIRAANDVISALKDETNTATPFSVTTLTAWSGITDLGHISGDNSGVLPDAVLKSGLADNGAPKQIRIGGLNAAKLYNLVFVGSQNEGPLATTEYAVGLQKSNIDARYNTTRSANINSLVPDASGQLLVTITRLDTTKVTYLNGIVIEEYDPSITLMNPNKLYAEPLDRNRVQLTWADRTNNETVAGGYELVRATDSLFSLNLLSISLPGNTTSYINTGLAANTRYWYRVRAKNGGSSSEFSNQVRVVTPASIVYVNFNTTVPNAPFPWVNLAAAPMSNFTYANLKNQSGVFTGISLKLEKVFNGEFTAGMNTGNNSGVVPDNVLMGNYWLDNTQVSQIRLSGLNHTRHYRFGFIGSSSPVGWFKGNYTAAYSINGKTVYLNSWMNTTKIVYINNIAPDAGGEVLLNFSTTASGNYGFNSGFIVMEYTDLQENGSIPPSNIVLLDEPAAQATGDENKNKIAIYPNPFSDIINIEFYNSSASNRITTEIYDLYGRIVSRQEYKGLTVGRSTLRVDAPGSAQRNGVFVVSLKVNGKTIKSVKMLRATK